MATTHLIAVGTQGGFVLVFDSCQVVFPILILSSNVCFKVIKWFLGGLDLGSNYGAVSSLAFNSDSTRLKRVKEKSVSGVNCKNVKEMGVKWEKNQDWYQLLCSGY